MPSGNEMDALMGSAIAKLELAKRDILTVFENNYPQMISDATRGHWNRALIMAHLAIDNARSDINNLFGLLNGGQSLPAHSKASEPGGIDQPINQELLAAVKRARQGVNNLIEFGILRDRYRDDAWAEIEQMDAAIAKAERR